MTKRLYYDDAYTTRFTADVVETLTWNGQPAVVLNRTAFYPTSGGQPADRGRLGGKTVLDVVEREEDGAVVHVLSEGVESERVEGEVAWDRRFDHMQQHTGQHILSAAFEQVIGAQTVGFHLGAQSSTIDVDQADLVMEDVLPVEARANDVVWHDRPIGVELLEGDALAGTGIEPPPDVNGPVRLVKIAGNASSDAPPLDINPCGGTHVARAGEIGLVKIVNLEHRGEDTRVEFLCGGRALRDYRAKLEVTSTLGRKLTVGTWELDQAVDRLQAENKTLRREQRDLRQRLLDLEAEHLVNQALSRGDFRFVGGVWEDRSPDELRSLALKIAEHSRHVALLFSVTDRTHYCFARAEDLDLDVNRLLQRACSRLDGKGGGRPHIAQGSAPRAAAGEVRDILGDLEAELGSAA